MLTDKVSNGWATIKFSCENVYFAVPCCCDIFKVSADASSATANDLFLL